MSSPLPVVDAAYLALDEGSKVVTINTTFTALATLTVILRFAARKIKKTGLAADDYLIFAALAFVWVLYGLSIACQLKGVGKHIEAVSKENVALILEMLYVTQIFYILAPAAIKLSLLFLYKRIFVTKRFTMVCNVLLGVVAVWVTIMTFMGIFNCTPVDAFWTGKGKCVNFKQFALGYAAVNIGTDLIIWVLPVPMVWKLQLPIGQKISLTLIFILGLFDCAAAITRLVTSMLVLGNRDVTWDYVPGFIWSIIEPSVGIMCACLPTIRVILLLIIPESWRSVFSLRSRTASGTKLQKTFESDWPRTAAYNEIHGAGKGTTVGSETASTNTDRPVELNKMDRKDGGITVSHTYTVEEEAEMLKRAA
ncbi:hypothetical protein BJ875DRAFT_458794 [Amylocarpus encephaloides]|uniref:Rhodopsin domain-containing protein n=1 Tax=Amylocarpus encephaloides TaxID=45428 RepID=A0A9P7YM62_9HELO|nr:hypothetical protein BJ875DRAFT_458794 [Amylocarpus encephaloides]